MEHALVPSASRWLGDPRLATRLRAKITSGVSLGGAQPTLISRPVPESYINCMQTFKIGLYAVAVLGSYGLIHDQVTSAIHAGWGVLPGVALGVLYGLGLTWAARSGVKPPREPSSLVGGMFFLVMLAAGLSLAAGLLGLFLAQKGILKLPDPDGEAAVIPPAQRHRQIACGLAHLAAWYTMAMTGGIQIGALWWQRRRRRPRVVVPSTNSAARPAASPVVTPNPDLRTAANPPTS